MRRLTIFDKKTGKTQTLDVYKDISIQIELFTRFGIEYPHGFGWPRLILISDDSNRTICVQDITPNNRDTFNPHFLGVPRVHSL
jgi:hypothetical protein